MEKKIAPSEQKAQALRALLQGQAEGQSGEELLSLLVRLSTERILQEALEQEQAMALGRGRYELRGEKVGYRNGYGKWDTENRRGRLARQSAADSGPGRTVSLAVMEQYESHQ